MTPPPASLYAQRSHRRLTERLGIAPDALPAGGNFHPEEEVLVMLAEEAAARRPTEAVVCGASAAVPVLALSGAGRVTVLESCGRMVSVLRRLLAATGTEARVIEEGLDEYDRHNLWYPRHCLDRVPDRIDLLFIDGPGHFAGRTPRWPAGPEFFARLAPDALVVLDDGRRVKEKKTARRWAEDHPDLVQSDGKGGTVLLQRQG